MFFSTPHAVTQTVVARAETIRKTPTTGFNHPIGCAKRPQRKKEQPRRPAGRKMSRKYRKTIDVFIDFLLPEKNDFDCKIFVYQLFDPVRPLKKCAGPWKRKPISNSMFFSKMRSHDILVRNINFLIRLTILRQKSIFSVLVEPFCF